MRRLLLIPILYSLLIVISGCDTRRTIGQDNWVTVEFTLNWEDLSRATKTEDITPNGATVAFFPVTGDLTSPLFKQTNFTEDKVTLPIGEYNIVVFNETVNGHDYIQFTGADSYDTFEAYWETTTVTAEYSRGDSDEMIIDTDDLLLVDRLEGFEITYQMSFANETQYLDFTPLVVNRQMTVLAHIQGLVNISKVSTSLLYVEGMASGYMMGTGEPSTGKTTHFMSINNKTYYDGSDSDGTMSATFYTFGDASSETKADDDNIVRLSLALRDGTTHPDVEEDVSEQLNSSTDLSEINIEVGVDSEIADSSSLSTESSAIGFTTFIDRATKGAVADQSTLQTNGFGVICYQQSGQGWVSDAEATSTLMGNYQVVYEDGAWNYDSVEGQDLVYWSENSTTEYLSFFAYSPYSDNDSTTDTGIDDITYTTTSATPYFTFETKNTIEDQIDLLATSKMNLTNTGSAVDFEFDHILSKIGFTIQSSLQTAGTAVAVTGVKVAVLDNTNSADAGSSKASLDADGVFTFAGTDGTTGASWAPTENPTPLAITAESIFNESMWDYSTTDKVAVTEDNSTSYTANSILLKQSDTDAKSITADDGYLMIIPQTLAAADIIEIAVEYYYITGVDGTSTITDDPLTKTVYIPTITYAAGKAYTYNIKVGRDAIVFDSTITVNDFDDVNTGTSSNLDLN